MAVAPETMRAAESWVKAEMAADSSGHDWWHVVRVRATALALAQEEGADLDVVELSALLHDIKDYKFSGSELAGPQVVSDWLAAHDVDPEVAAEVVEIIAKLSYRGALVSDQPLSLAGRCVRDADRLDALGAIGIARAFAFGGYNGQPLHEPGVQPTLHADPAAYRQKTCSTINHFYEKLLLLAERMETQTGLRVAHERTRLMQEFLAAFLTEWEGRDVESSRARATG